jgi:outer membrane protein assembly factor BamB
MNLRQLLMAGALAACALDSGAQTLLWQNSFAATPIVNGTPAKQHTLPVRLVVDRTGQVFVASFYRTPGASGSELDFLTTKVSSANGSLSWSSPLAGLHLDTPSDLVVDSGGDAYVTGLSSPPSGFQDMRTLKYQGSDGTLLWERSFDGAAHKSDLGLSLVLGGQGRVAVTGTTEVGTASYRPTLQVYQAATGSPLWNGDEGGPSLPAPAPGQGSLLAADAAGNFILATSTANGGIVSKRAFLNGQLFWQRSLGARFPR